MIGKGRLRHRFHGTYTAVLAIGFDTPEAAAAAKVIVGEPFEITSDPRAIVAVFTSEALDAFKSTHAARIAILPCSFRHCSRTLSRCKATAIDALTHSVDLGPAFSFNAGEIASHVKGRCVCGASGFRYSLHREPRGYECMTCGAMKPEVAPRKPRPRCVGCSGAEHPTSAKRRACLERNDPTGVRHPHAWRKLHDREAKEARKAKAPEVQA